MCGVVLFVAPYLCTILYIVKSILCIEQEYTARGFIWWNFSMVNLYNNIWAGRERKSYHVYRFHERNLKEKP